MRSRIAILLSPILVAGTLLAGIDLWDPAAPAQTSGNRGLPTFEQLPSYVVENRGQLAESVKFTTLGGSPIAFTDGGLQVRLDDRSGTTQAWGLHLDFLGARPSTPEGVLRQAAVVSTFRGDPSEWTVGAPTYSGVAYRDLWPGVDLVAEGGADRLKYSFVLEPGADPSDIRMRWRGAESLVLDRGGNLRIGTPAGVLLDEAPVTFQTWGDRERRITSSYSVDGSSFGFDVGRYDASRSLVIDPALVYAGYIGGALGDGGDGIAVDAAGNAYVVGHTSSPQASFPVAVGPDTTHNGDADAFVAKVNPAGTGLIYAGYIGGDQADEGREVAVDPTGAAYVTGYAESTQGTFPIVGPLDPTHNGDTDAFVAKLAPSGASLLYSGYIGGDLFDYGNGIAVDGAGAAYVVGRAGSDEATFPETVGPDLTHNMGDDAFVAKVNPTGSSLVYAGYIGGDMDDVAWDVAVDGAGQASVIGDADSDQNTFPDGDGFGGVPGPDPGQNGGTDAFVAKVSATGATLLSAGYVGGNGFDFGKGIAVDAAGAAYLAGFTSSDETTFPETVGPDLTKNVNDDAYVAKLNPAGTTLLYAGFLGGDDMDFGEAIAVDPTGAAYVVGYTNSTEATFPVLDAPDPTANGGNDGFVAKVQPSGAALAYAGFLGGAADDSAENVAVGGGGAAYVVGDTSSTEATFPDLVGPDTSFNGGSDAFVAKVATTETCQGQLVTHLGSGGNDVIRGTGNTDVVLALGGNDRINVLGGWDRVCAGSDNDRVKGGGGNDRLLGEQGRDNLNGGAGKRDLCKGGPGKDKGGKGCEKGRL